MSSDFVKSLLEKETENLKVFFDSKISAISEKVVIELSYDELRVLTFIFFDFYNSILSTNKALSELEKGRG